MSTRFYQALLTVLVVSFLSIACSGSVSPPTFPSDDSSQEITVHSGGISPQTHLWGFYDVTVDTQSGTVEYSQNRNAAFTANITNFLNSNPLSLNFDIIEIVPGPDFIDIDIDVEIRHPFPGFPQYHGYDVRGVFMGDGSRVLQTGAVFVPDPELDQFMLPDPDDGYGCPDGYTRWYNITEFSEGGMPLFNYTPGLFASQGFQGSATVCPYKYYADSLDSTSSVFSFLDENSNLDGVFSSGASNARNYYLRFPDPDPGVTYGYAVIANWNGPEDDDHPANAPEAVACDIVDTSDVYFVDDTTSGGSLKLDISIFDWDATVTSGVMEDYNVIIESTVLTTPYTLDAAEMAPVDGNGNYSTYHVEIPADNVTGIDNQDYFVIVEYPEMTYENPYGVGNLGESPLMAFFRFDLEVTDTVESQDPICDLVIDPASPTMPFEGWGAFIFDASGSYDPDGTNLTFEWDFDNDGVFGDYYNYGTQDMPVKVFEFTNQDQVCVRITDENGGSAECCVAVDIIGYPSKNIPLRPGVIPYDIAYDHGDGDMMIYYEDRQVWRYTPSDWFQTDSLVVTTHSAYAGQDRIDIAANGWFLCAGYIDAYQRPMGQFYDPDGANPQYWNFEWGPSGFVSDEYRFPDVIAFGESGSHVNDIGPVTGAPYIGNHEMRFLNLNDSNNYHSWTRYRHQHSGTDHIGFDKLYYDYVTGAESDQDGELVWFVENTDFYATRWQVQPPAGNSTYTFMYDNYYFGSGSQTDDDDGWNNALDITRDDQNRYFVLDSLSDDTARIKVWNVDDSSPDSLGGFGDSTTISSTPLRIEGSDYNGFIFILHGNETDGYFYSAFLPGEMPS